MAMAMAVALALLPPHAAQAARADGRSTIVWSDLDRSTRWARSAQRAQTRTSRTAYVAPDEAPATVAAVRAALDCLDFMVGSMSTTSREILGGLMHGHAQHDVADRVGISPSAVSQRVRRDEHRGRARGDHDARRPAVTWLSIVLAGIGVGDIVRSTSWRPGRAVGHVAAPVVILGLALVAGMHGWADLLALALAAVARVPL